MSGCLEVKGLIQDWESIQNYLEGNQLEQDDWGWEETEEEESNVIRPSKKGSWIQECVVAVSPMEDVMVVAKGQKTVFLSSEWDSQARRVRYTKVYQDSVSLDGETITSAVCIPLASSKKSSPGAPDWTCVVLGFSNGYVRMYTENGTMLISQMFHDQGVTAFKCRSYKPASSQNEHDQLEEVFILYKTVLVTVEGFGLFQTLRGCRSRIAKVKANVAEAMGDSAPLSYKKWQYGSDGVADCECIGVKTPSTFDHLLAASLIGGLNAKASKVPYTSTVFTAVGTKPYVSFHYAQEGQAPFMIGQLAHMVASKVTNHLINAASGWLGFGGNRPSSTASKPETPRIEPATPMASRFGLRDVARRGQSITLSPCHKLSAITDSLGRVVLVDNERGIAVRMWKGCRDAQCAWLSVADDMNSKTRASGRKALFLVIYAPRKGQLEVYSMQQGPKVASFAVSKSGSLIGLPYGMMGLNNIPVKGANQQMLSCLFLDPDGQVQQLHIPFHLALCDTSNSKLKDMHLLKTLQRMLRDGGSGVEEIGKILHDIKTQAMINQAFKILIQYCKNYDVLLATVEGYMEKFCEDDHRDLSIPFKIQSLLHLYSFLVTGAGKPPPYSKAESSSSGDNTVLLCLHATEKEIKLVKDMANKELFNKPSPSKGVSFADEKDGIGVSMNDFLSVFSIEYDPNKIKAASSSDENKLHLNLKSDNLCKFNLLLLCGCLNSQTDLHEWTKLIKNCGLVPLELLQETLKFWCTNALSNSSFIDMMERLYKIVRALCDLEGVASTLSESSIWWDMIRRDIATGRKTFYNYIFAIVCRAVTIDLNHELTKNEEHVKTKNKKADRANPTCPEAEQAEDAMEMESSPSLVEEPDTEGWENVSLDLIRWNILLKQLEDLSFLTTILAQRPSLRNPTLPKLPAEIGELSVMTLLDKGSGCIAELLGRWLTSTGVDPSLIIENSEIPVREVKVAPEYTEKEMKQKRKSIPKEEEKKVEGNEDRELEGAASVGSEINYIRELLRCLKDNFPISLNSSIILSNYCWEYCLSWNQDVENINLLNAAIKCASVVPSNHVKQGLMFMMWNTFVSKQLQGIVGRGKLRRDQLLEKTTVINNPESRVGFLHACVKFLDDFMENNVICQGEQQPKPPNRKSHWSSVDSSVTASLTELALQQPRANYEMILLHYQLALTGLFVQNFGIRKISMRPLNLFDTKACTMFFAPITNPAPYSNVEVDLALKVLREEFLCLVVTNIIGKIPEDLDDSGDDDNGSISKYISPSPVGVSEYENWIHKCFELGRTWGLDLDGLRINQVCELYSCGFDFLGLECTGAVGAKDILGSKLLVIAGMRLNYHIQSHRDATTEIVSSMSTNLSNWLNKLDYSKLRCLRFPQPSITDLARQVVHLIPESSYDHKLADDLLVCSSFLNH